MVKPLILFPRTILPPTAFLVVVALFLTELAFPRPAAAAALAPAGQPLTMTAGLQLSPTYRTNCWLPLHLEFRNDSDAAITGTAGIPLADPQAPAVMRLPVTVPPHARVAASLWAYFPPPMLTAEKAQIGNIPPLTMAEFRDQAGALLSRAEVVGVPLGGGLLKDATDRDDRAEMILTVGPREALNDEAFDATWMIGRVSEETGVAMAVAKVAVDRLPREAAGLASLKAVVLDAVDPQDLDLTQRAALLDYLRGGGVIVLAAPPIDSIRAGTWLWPLLPVRPVGTRQVRQIEVAPGGGGRGSGAALKLREPATIVEAVPADGATVLLHDRDYVHVAARTIGAGKVVFTSFPINGLDPAQPQMAALWEQLLSLRQPQWDWNRSHLGDVRHEVLGAMTGRRVAPWSVAAGVTAGYLALIVAAQVLFFGAARPRAFVVSVAAAGIFSAALLAMGMVRRGERTPQAARLAILDIAPDAGGGWRRESVAFVGVDDPEMRITTAKDESIMLRPALADPRNRPTVRQQPFMVENAQMFAERIERAWEASKPLESAWRIIAAAQLGPDGLTLNIDNMLATKIESPLIIWNGRALAIADLPTGRTTVREMQSNPRRQFTGLGVITSEQAKRRAQVIAASLAPASGASTWSSADSPPMLVGWIDDANDRLVAPVGRDEMDVKSMVLVRTPLRFNTAAAQTAASIPAALVRVDTGRMPYDAEKGESVPTPQGGAWEITFAPPVQMGRVQPNRITLAAHVTLPAHTLRLRMASRADPVEWSRKVGGIEKTFNCAAGDYDNRGRVKMMLDIESLDASNTVPWQISHLEAEIDGTIAGPPEQIVLDAPAATRPAAQEK